MKPKKIIHLSDLHLGYEDDDLSCEQNVKKVIDWIASNCTPCSEYVIVITGDLINNANVAKQWKLASQLIQSLGESSTTGESYDLLLIPGNHDYGTGSNADPKFVPKFKQQYFSNPDFEYPRIDIIGDGTNHEKIAFIGLDSNEDELNPEDHRLADGELGNKQLGLLEDALRCNNVQLSDYIVVYLHHHPFESFIFKYGHWLKDRHELKHVLTTAIDEGIKIDALLFGHNHGGKPKHNKWGIPRVYDGGTTGGKRKPSFIRIIDLSNPDVDTDKMIHFADD